MVGNQLERVSLDLDVKIGYIFILCWNLLIVNLVIYLVLPVGTAPPEYPADQSVKATEGTASAPPLPLEGTQWDWDSLKEAEHPTNHSPKFFTRTHPGGLVSSVKI
jgi:hypothetical protein